MELIFNPILETINQAVPHGLGALGVTHGWSKIYTKPVMEQMDADMLMFKGVISGAMMVQGWTSPAFLSSEDFTNELWDCEDKDNQPDWLMCLYRISQGVDKPWKKSTIEFGSNEYDFNVTVCLYPIALEHPTYGVLDIITAYIEGEGGAPTDYFFHKSSSRI